MTITTKSRASGCLFVIAAPSGGGKTSLVNALLEREPGIRLSVSYTTRAPRPGEQDGVHYHFVDVPRFMALQGRRRVPRARARARQLVRDVGDLARRARSRRGHDVLLEIDWQGAAQVRRLVPGCGADLHPAAVDRVAAGAAAKSAGRTAPR